jgi:phage/plasmid-like protein (TIGR03299 family)
MSRQIWLDYGKILPKKVKTAAQAMQIASLSWHVEHRKIKVVDGLEIPDKVAIVRTDTNKVLGIVNSTYKTIQNTNVFSFLDTIVQEGKASFYAAGFVGEGEKVWLLVKLNDDIEIHSKDIVQKFILFSNAHDGRGAIRAYFVPLRFKTQTLLNISFGKRVEQGIQLRHVGKVEQRIQDAKKVFSLAEDFYNAFEAHIQKLYSSSFRQKKVDLFFSSCFENYSVDSTRTQNTFKKIRELYENEIKTFTNSSDTAWAWLNAVVDFIDYERLSKGKNLADKTSNHIESLYWGSGLLLKQKAWNTISTLIKL